MSGWCLVLRVAGNDRLKYGIAFRNRYLGELQNIHAVSLNSGLMLTVIYCANNIICV